MICAMAASVALFADETTATFGLIRVTDTASCNTIIGVPWKNIGDDGNVTLSNLVSTANLEAGDIVYLYDDDNDTWCGYELSGGVWVALTTVNGTDVVNPQGADAKRLERGAGLIIQRAHNTNPIYLCGRLDDTTPSATVIAANSTVLFANPLTVTNDMSSVGANGDQIRVLKDNGGTTIYEKNSSGVWGTYVEQQAAGRGGRPGKITRTWTPGCELAPGMGAWYVSGTTGTSITWGN